MKVHTDRKEEYIGIKIGGYPCYMWFKSRDVDASGETLDAKSGWGKNGELVTISVYHNQIEGVIYTNAPVWSK